MIKPVHLLITFFLSVLACKQSKDLKNNVAVELGNHQLTFDEIGIGMPEGLNQEDSSLWANNYIDKWIKEKLLLQEAEEKLKNNQKQDIQNKVKQYQQDLLLNEYTNQLLQQVENDSVSEQEIQQHYKENQQNFLLNRQLFKIQLYTFPQEQQKQVIALLGKPSKRAQLKQMAQKQNLPYYVTDSVQWDSKEQILGKVKDTFQEEIGKQSLRSNQFFKKIKNGFVYMLKLDKVLQKGQIAPVDYVKSSIKNIIINKRKLNLLDNLKDELYQQAKSKNRIKQYKSN